MINSEIRQTILTMVNRGGAAHIGSALSSVEILNAVFNSIDIDKVSSQAADRDRVILSKGHGTSSLYAVMYHHGVLTDEDLEAYFTNGSTIAGHTSHFIDNVEHSTGALGHGLSAGLGMAIGSKSKGFNNRVFVVVGDGDLHEGSNWEAIMFAGHRMTGNLCVFVDNNERAQMGDTNDACSLNPLLEKFQAFNFDSYELDGHDEEKIIEVIEKTKSSVKPVAIICKTTKGKGVSFMEGNNLWHYRTPEGDDFSNAMQELT